MTVSGRFQAFAVVFSAVFAVTYVFAVEKNLALFTYHPAFDEWNLLVARPKGAPAMYWYGWLTTCALAATAAGALASQLPEQWGKRIWPCLAWAVPVVVMGIFCYLLRGYFLR